MLKTRRRVGDAAEMAFIELVQEGYSPDSKKKKTRKVAKKKETVTAIPVEESSEAATELQKRSLLLLRMKIQRLRNSSRYGVHEVWKLKGTLRIKAGTCPLAY